jgi:transposase
MTKQQIEVITSVERRRRWSREEKERLVGATFEPGASVSELARQRSFRCAVPVINSIQPRTTKGTREQNWPADQLSRDCRRTELGPALKKKRMNEWRFLRPAQWVGRFPKKIDNRLGYRPSYKRSFRRLFLLSR